MNPRMAAACRPIQPVLAVAVLVLAIGPAAGAGPAIASLTPPLRERIDGLADATPAETLSAEKLNIAGNVAAWMIGQALPSAAEEQRAAAAAHELILRKYRTVPTPPDSPLFNAQLVFQKLLAALPPSLKPQEFRYTLTILDVPEITAFTNGGGFVYISRLLLVKLLDSKPHGPAALAFVLANELGHLARLHCRRGYQLLQFQEEARKGIPLHVENKLLQAILQTSLHTGGDLAKFLYTRGEAYEADLFAWQLCRNAGFDPDGILDGLRWLAVFRYPKIVSDQGYRPDAVRDLADQGLYLSAHPGPLLRLKRLLLERAGRVEKDSDFGLYVYDRPSAKWLRAERRLVDPRKRQVVLVHGLHGNEQSFTRFVQYLEGKPAAEQLQVFRFRYPNDGSLDRSAHLLANEADRVFPAGCKPVFVCHSAGGLVFRDYAEHYKGPFDRAIFLGTPHAGSNLLALKFLLDAGEFLAQLKVGLPEAIAQTVAEGHGEIHFDLQPDSLFLRYLARNKELAGRYHVICGRALRPTEAVGLQLLLNGIKPSLSKLIADKVQSPSLRQQAERFLNDLELPAEVTVGDLVVSVQSASLPGAASQQTLAGVNHQSLKTDDKVLERVLRIILGEAARP